MKSEILLNYIGEIDDRIISEADKPIIKNKSKHSWVKWASAAASIVLIFTLALSLNNYFTAKKPNSLLLGRTFSSINEIPVAEIGNNFLIGCNDHGPVEVFTIDGNFYFSMVTRWVGNDETRETINYYTLFKYDPENGSSTAVSDEVGYIHFVNNQFIYDRSGIYLTADNRLTVQYYSNNSDWNNEKKITSDTARELMNLQKGSGSAKKINNQIEVKMSESGREYVVKPDSSIIVSFDVIGVVADKLFISGYTSDNQNALYSIDLENSKLSQVMIGDTAVSGICAYIGDDNFIYANNRNVTSTLIKVDPVSNNAVAISEVKAFVWEYVVNGKYAVCMIAGKSSADSTSIIAVKLK